MELNLDSVWVFIARCLIKHREYFTSQSESSNNEYWTHVNTFFFNTACTVHIAEISTSNWPYMLWNIYNIHAQHLLLQVSAIYTTYTHNIYCYKFRQYIQHTRTTFTATCFGNIYNIHTQNLLLHVSAIYTTYTHNIYCYMFRQYIQHTRTTFNATCFGNICNIHAQHLLLHVSAIYTTYTHIYCYTFRQSMCAIHKPR